MTLRPKAAVTDTDTVTDMVTNMENTRMAANRRKEKDEAYITNNEYKRDSNCYPSYIRLGSVSI